MPSVGLSLPAVVRLSSACSNESCVSNWKITFSILLVVESLVFGHIIMLMRAFSCISPNKLLTIMRYGSAVAGGIFLSTGLLHIIPESLHLYEEHLSAVAVDPHAGHDHTGHNHASHAHALVAAVSSFDRNYPVIFSIILASFYWMLILEHVLIASCQKKTIESDDNVSYDPDDSDSINVEVFGRASLNLAHAIGMGSGHEMEGDELSGAGYMSREFLGCLVVTIGVAAHSILESVALGAARRFDQSLSLFVAIAAHRWATAAALGIRYARAGVGTKSKSDSTSKLTRRQQLAAGPVVLLVVIFSFVAPIGVAFGFLANEVEGTVVQAVLFSLAAGTFLYLGGSATLASEEPDSMTQLKMYLASAAGAMVMIVITVILVATNNSHTH